MTELKHENKNDKLRKPQARFTQIPCAACENGFFVVDKFKICTLETYSEPVDLTPQQSVLINVEPEKKISMIYYVVINGIRYPYLDKEQRDQIFNYLAAEGK